MKKLFISLLLLGSLFTASAGTSTMTVLSAGRTNLLPSAYNGSIKVSSIVVTATTATNTTIQLIDTPTTNGVFTYILPAYTNIVSYGTNLVVTWTNYFGATNSWTNISLVDISNPVAATTNNYPVRGTVSAVASTSTTVSPVNINFDNGIWVTNTSLGTASVTITWQQ